MAEHGMGQEGVAAGRGVQEALELRHSAEELAERCRRIYEEANTLVERLRRLAAAAPADPEPPDAARSGPERT